MPSHDHNPSARTTEPAIKTHRLFTAANASIAKLLSHSSNRLSPGFLKALLQSTCGVELILRPNRWLMDRDIY
jgi:hypothetical protein